MNSRWPTRAALWSVLLLAGSMSSCYAHTISTENTLARIKETKMIRLGYEEDAFPFSYVESGHPVGFAIDVCNEIVKSLKTELDSDDLKVKWVRSSTASQFVQLNARAMDIMCTPAFYSPERHQLAEFSPPFFFANIRFMARKSDNNLTFASLSGHSILIKSGTTYLKQLHQLSITNGLNINVELDNNNKTAFEDIQNGKFAAQVASTVQLKALIAQSAHPEDFFISQERLCPPVPAGLLLPLRDIEFKKFMDEAMDALVTSSTFSRIYQKWFLEPISPLNINLNQPMSNELRILTSSKNKVIYDYEKAD